MIKTRLDRKATNIPVLAAIGVHRDGQTVLLFIRKQTVLLFIRNMGGESPTFWRQFLDDLDARGMKRPEFVIVDGAPGLCAPPSQITNCPRRFDFCSICSSRPGVKVFRLAPNL